jgi:hypothetical protein
MILGNRDVLWPHHQHHKKAEDYASFQRAVQRMRNVFDRKDSRCLFLLAIPVTSILELDAMRSKGPPRVTTCSSSKLLEDVESSSSLGSVEEVRRLYLDMTRRVKGSFQLDVVYVLSPPASEAVRGPTCTRVHKESTGKSSMSVHELHCRNTNTGLFFKDKSDARALHQLVIKGRSFQLAKVDDSWPVGMSDNLKGGRSRPPSSSRQIVSLSKSTGAPRTGARLKAKLRSRLVHRTREGLNRKIQVLKENPKKPASSAHQRYEKYKVAKTVQQFFELGGAPGDLSFDVARGWIKFR